MSTQLTALARRLVTEERAASHLEYALIAVGTGTALIAGLLVLTGGLNEFFTNTAETLANLL